MLIKIIKKINNFFLVFGRLKIAIKNYISYISHELKIIFRNGKYSKVHPELFAIFSIIENEQNPNIYEANKDDFNKIKLLILNNHEYSNAHILEAIRGLFQNNHLVKSHNYCRDLIADYLFIKTKKMMFLTKSKYYNPLIESVLIGFPFLLNKNNFYLFRLLVKQNRESSTNMIKTFLHKNSSIEFINNKSDCKILLLSCLASNNKVVFMLLIRFIRMNKWIDVLFDSRNINIFSRVINLKFIKKYGADYFYILFSYIDNLIIENISIKRNSVIFLNNLFSLSIQKNQLIKHYKLLNSYIEVNRAANINNSEISTIIYNIFKVKISGDIDNETNYQKGDRLPKPSNNFSPKIFKPISGTYFSEERWLMLNNIDYSHYSFKF